jgi:esterase/lipase superfamily enzyme
MARSSVWKHLIILAVAGGLAGCAQGILPGGMASNEIEPGSLALDGPLTGDQPEVVHLPRYALTGRQPEAARSVLAIAAVTSPSAPLGTPPKVAGPQQAFEVVTLFYGTNRGKIAVKPTKPSGVGAEPRLDYGSARAKALSLGVAQVTVPKYDRAVGAIRRPRQVAYLRFEGLNEKEDPTKHFTIGNLRDLDRTAFFAMANAQGAKAREFKDHAFVFVHGYNTTFENGVFRAAQLAHDMGFDGVPYVFSWPSKGETIGYPYDRDSVDVSAAHLADFLDLVAKRSSAKKIHIVAHSMGARLVLDTVFPARSGAPKIPKLDQIIFAAADVDSSVLEQRSAAIVKSGLSVTSYASKNDHALTVSKTFAGGVPRAGDVGEKGPLVAAGVDTVDISETSTSIFGGLNHASFAERAHVLTDMSLLMRTGLHPPDRRFPVFKPMTTEAGGPYWRYVNN